MPQLPESILPELRAKWVRLSGAQEVTSHAVRATRQMEEDYQSSLSMALRMLGLNPEQNWKVNLETGELGEVTQEDVLRQRGQTNGISVPHDPSLRVEN